MHSTHRSFALLRLNVIPVMLALLVAVSLTACDLGSQNIEFTSGSSLTVSGPASLTLPADGSSVTGEYQVRAFTIKQDYSWSASGSAEIVETKRQGENVVVSFSEAGSYDVTVTTTIDGEEYSGSATTQVSAP